MTCCHRAQVEVVALPLANNIIKYVGEVLHIVDTDNSAAAYRFDMVRRHCRKRKLK